MCSYPWATAKSTKDPIYGTELLISFAACRHAPEGERGTGLSAPGLDGRLGLSRTAVTSKDYVERSPEITGLRWRSVSVRRGRA
jgi:hypothetical protein